MHRKGKSQHAITALVMHYDLSTDYLLYALIQLLLLKSDAQTYHRTESEKDVFEPSFVIVTRRHEVLFRQELGHFAN